MGVLALKVEQGVLYNGEESREESKGVSHLGG